MTEQNLYVLDPEMVEVIEQISAIKPDNARCITLGCLGDVCLNILVARNCIRALKESDSDSDAYGDQIVTIGLSAYSRHLKGDLDRRMTCQTVGMYPLLIKLGELAYPQFAKDEEE